MVRYMEPGIFGEPKELVGNSYIAVLYNGCDVVKSYPSEGIEKQQEKRAACAGNWNCANVFSAHPSTG